jgi:threonine dehydrogenase-like Zn-dependent dehydrogenase
MMGRRPARPVHQAAPAVRGEVSSYGPGSRRKLPIGTPVVALPLRRRGDEVHAIGLSAKAPGAYAEQVLVEEALMFALPNGLSPNLAVLTEPLAIGRHAVRRLGL